jgi:hypothetical protein
MLPLNGSSKRYRLSRRYWTMYLRHCGRHGRGYIAHLQEALKSGAVTTIQSV